MNSSRDKRVAPTPPPSAGVMTVTLDKSKGTCVGNDNRDLSYVVRLMLLHVSNLVKQTPFLVYFASFFWSNISTSDLKGILIRICDFGKYALVLGDSVGHVVSALDSQSGMFQFAIRMSQVPL